MDRSILSCAPLRFLSIPASFRSASRDSFTELQNSVLGRDTRDLEFSSLGWSWVRIHMVVRRARRGLRDTGTRRKQIVQ